MTGNDFGVSGTIAVLKSLSTAASLGVLKLGTVELDLSSECSL